MIGIRQYLPIEPRQGFPVRRRKCRGHVHPGNHVQRNRNPPERGRLDRDRVRIPRLDRTVDHIAVRECKDCVTVGTPVLGGFGRQPNEIGGSDSSDFSLRISKDRAIGKREGDQPPGCRIRFDRLHEYRRIGVDRGYGAETVPLAGEKSADTKSDNELAR